MYSGAPRSLRRALEYICGRIPDAEKVLRNGRQQFPRNGMSEVVLIVKVLLLKKKSLRKRTQLRTRRSANEGYHTW